MGESSLQHVTTLKSLVIIGNLIVKRENVSSKTQISQKNVTSSKMYILRRSAQKLKIFPLMTTFYNFTLKIETSLAKNVVKSILET